MSEVKNCIRNLNNPVKTVKHSDLKRFSDDSLYRSKCPVCNEGVLMVGRSQQTFELLEVDHCTSCGQPFRYEDINELRANDEGKILEG